MFLGLALASVAINLGRQALPPLLPTIIDDLAISPAAAGFALTVMWGLYALLQYPAGLVSDRSRRGALVLGLILIAVGFGLLTATRSYETLLLATAVTGLGAAFFMIANRVVLSDLYVRRRGIAFGVNIAAGQLGSTAAAGLAVLALAVATWQAAFLPLVGVLALTAGAFHVLGTDSYAIGTIDWNVKSTARRVFAETEIRRILVAYTIVIFAWQGITAFIPAFLQAERGLSPALAGGGFATIFAIGLVIQPLSGWISDRFPRPAVAAGAIITAATGLALLLVVESLVGILITIVIFAVGLSAFPPVMQAYLMDVFPEDTKGGDLGAFKTIYEGIGGIGPTYVGVVASMASYTVAFAGLLVILIGSAGLLAWIAWRR